MEQEQQPAMRPIMAYFSVIRDPRIERNEPPRSRARAKGPAQCLKRRSSLNEGSIVRKFIILSGLIPNFVNVALFEPEQARTEGLTGY
jgi:hypothetical protein